MANILYDALIGNRSGNSDPCLSTVSGAEFTSQDIALKAGSAAHALTRAGLQPGDRVMVQAEKSLAFITLYLGAIRAGVIFVPLNTAYTAHEVDYFLGDCEPSLLVSTPDKAAELDPLCKKHGTRLMTLSDDGEAGSWPEFCGQTCSAVFATERTASDIAAILYTSGTTGRSKGAMLTHENLLSNARCLEEAWAFTSDDIVLHTLPTYHTHGLFVALNTALVAGASVLLCPRFSPELVVENLSRATVLMGVPTHYVRLLADGSLNADNTAHMRLFTSGSAPLLAETHYSFTAATGHAIVERYGLTETSINTSNPHDGERRPGTVGFPLSGITVEVRGEETGKPLKPGETGSVEVSGPNVFAGYWRQPEKTYETFREDGFFITGDLGSYDEDGYLTIVGRAKDLIITGGLNVYPKEVELAIDEIDGVEESAVIGAPHPDFGEGVTAVVVSEPGSDITEAGIKQQLGDKLAKFKQPKSVQFIDALPRNTMGKVQKNVLREQFSKLYSG